MELGGSCDHSEWPNLLFAMPPEYRRWGTHSSRRGKRKLRSAYLRLSQAQRSCAGQTPSISSISKANLYGAVSNNRHPKRGPDATHDYEVNLKAEIEIMALHDKVDQMRDIELKSLIDKQQQQIELLAGLLINRSK